MELIVWKVLKNITTLFFKSMRLHSYMQGELLCAYREGHIL
jgi:hypothetical protein